MIKVLIRKVAFLDAPISDVATLLSVPDDLYTYIEASVDFGSGDYTYLTLSEGDIREEIKVTDVSGGALVIERGTPASAFTIAASVDTYINKAAVEDIAAGTVAAPTFNITGTGIATVQDLGGGNFNVNVPQPVITGVSGIEATAAYPDYQVGLVANGACCEGEGGTTTEGGITEIVGGGIVDVAPITNGFSVTVPAPNFTGPGLAVTGTWPDLVFTFTAGGVGTVTSVGVGAGLSLTGSPTVNPVISISNTGVSAGAYGDITFNSRGQATSIAATFNPISSIVAGDGIQVARVGGEVTVAGLDAAVGTKGIVALADDGAPLDPGDATTAVTPALLASVINDIDSPEALGGQTYVGESDASYTDTVPTTALTLTLADASDVALVIANVTMLDGTTPLTPIAYGMAVFSLTGGARLQANKTQTQSSQTMAFLVVGPFNDNLILKTTATPGGASVVSQSLIALRL